MNRKITCGIFIINDNSELLLCHPTHAPDSVLSIPKGLSEDEEYAWQTAIRETFEETGIEIFPEKLFYVGDCDYTKRNKTLIGFYTKYNFDISKLICNSYVDGDRFPEIDYYKAIKIEDADKYLHHTQRELLEQIKIILNKEVL